MCENLSRSLGKGVRKFIELTRGCRKIYRPECMADFWPKTAFFYTAWQDTWAISDFDLVGWVVRKFFGLTRGWVRKFIELTRWSMFPVVQDKKTFYKVKNKSCKIILKNKFHQKKICLFEKIFLIFFWGKKNLKANFLKKSYPYSNIFFILCRSVIPGKSESWKERNPLSGVR